ncbi:MAG: hypothetical protein AAF514_09440 [Verrucomicrobiota bacterium]
MKLLKVSTAIAGIISLPSAVFAGDMASPLSVPSIMDPPPLVDSGGGASDSSGVSGSLSFDYNSHFISYGADVWGAGKDLDDALFNPSIELTFQITDDVSFSLGTWWDVNDNAVSSIGGESIQEVDVWAGLHFGIGAVSVSLVYQEWLYAQESERIIDVILGLDAPFSPSLTFHNRVAEGASGGDTGTVAVLGFEHGFSLGSVDFSIPLNVAAATDGYHGGDSGFAYASIGLSASVPLTFVNDDLGSWNLHGGLTAFFTSDDVIPNNADENFVTANVGIGVDF